MKNKARKEESEIYYTGGGVWCGVIPLGLGLWFSGELNGHGAIWKTRDSAIESLVYEDPNFIRFTHEEDFPEVLSMWRKAILYERTNVHNQACYAEKWLEENKEIKKKNGI